MLTKNANYIKYEAQWIRIRDVIEGQDAVKDKGVSYLPILSGQTPAEYAAYKQRALFVSITDRIVMSNVGMITRRSPEIKYPDALSYLFKGSMVEKSFSEVFRYVVGELLQMGRVALLVDIKDQQSTILRYSTESILDWYIDNNGQLTDVILMADVADDMRSATNTVHYHLKLRDDMYSIDELDSVGNMITTTTPMVKGRPVPFIPFIGMTTEGMGLVPVKSPIINIVNINLSHYMSSADLENGRHYTSLPTPVVTGATTDTELRIGSSVAWVLPDPGSKAFFLEFRGQGLMSLEKALVEKQAQMSQFNANLLDNSTRGSEAEGIVRLRHSADATTLSDIADITESGLRLVYGIAAEFNGLSSEEISIKLYKDFLSTKLSPLELKELSSAYINGSIDKQTFIYNLQRGEMLSPDGGNIGVEIQNAER